MFLEFAVFLTSGVLICKRKKLRVFKVRSPNLIQISHWCNFAETLIVIYAVEVNKSDLSTEWITVFTTFAHFITHYLFFIPFLLRSYRLYVIFNLDQNWSSADKSMRINMKRTREGWLIKVLIVISTPFVFILVLAYIFSPLHFIVINGSQASDRGAELPAHIISVFLIFIEQMCSVIAVYAIRNINDDFSMKTELILVNMTWIITSPNNIFGSYSVYAYQILLRNNIVCAVSSIYPLYKSMKAEIFEVPITEEVLHSLALILSNKLTFESFEDFLMKNEIEYKHHLGTNYLELWVKCEYLLNVNDPSIMMPPLASTFGLPLTDIRGIRDVTFQALDLYFYPLFKASEHFNSCLREVNKQNLYNSRMNRADMGHYYSGQG